MKTFAIAAAVAMTAIAATPAHAAELVVNGGFETGGFDGWTLSGNTAASAVTGTFLGVAPNSGSFQARFGQVDTPGGIFQTLNTVVGETYRISVWLANTARADGTATPNFASLSFGDQTPGALFDFPEFPYSNIVFEAVATSDRTDLSLSFQHDPAYFLLDDVSVEGLAGTPGGDPGTPVGSVPEPSSWAMMTLGFGALGGALRRRRKVAVSFG